MVLGDSLSFLLVFFAVAALPFVLGAGLVTSQDAALKRASFVCFCIGVILLWIPVLFWSCTVLELAMAKRYVIAGVSSACFGLFIVWIGSVLGVIPREIAIAQTPTQVPSQNCTGNCSFGQIGGTIIQNYNQEPQRLPYSDELAAAIASRMTASKVVILRGVGGEKDQEIVSQYAHYFVNHGFQIKLFSIGMLAPPPDTKITLRETESNYEVTLAPSAF